MPERRNLSPTPRVRRMADLAGQHAGHGIRVQHLQPRAVQRQQADHGGLSLASVESGEAARQDEDEDKGRHRTWTGQERTGELLREMDWLSCTCRCDADADTPAEVVCGKSGIVGSLVWPPVSPC